MATVNDTHTCRLEGRYAASDGLAGFPRVIPLGRGFRRLENNPVKRGLKLGVIRFLLVAAFLTPFAYAPDGVLAPETGKDPAISGGVFLT